MDILNKKIGNIKVIIFLEIFALLFLTIFINVLSQPNFFDQNVFNDDSFSFFVFWNIKDPDLFVKNDPIYVYTLERMHSVGEKILAPFLYHSVPLPFSSKFLNILLQFIASIYLFKLGKKLKGKYFGFFIVLVFLFYSQTLEGFGGHLPAGFAFPIITYFVYHLMEKSKNKALLAILASGILVPYLLPPLFLAFLFYTQFDWNNKKFKFNFIDFRNLLIVFILGLITIMPTFFLSDIIGEPYSVEEFSQMVEFNEFEASGYGDFFLHPLIIFKNFLDIDQRKITNLSQYFNPRNYFKFNFITVFFIISAIIFFILFRKKCFNLPLEVWLVYIGSVISYIFVFLSFYIAPLLLHFPLPYLRSGRVFFYVFFFSWNFWNLLSKGKNKIFSIIVIVLLCSGMFFYARNFENNLAYCSDVKLYNFFQNTPKDSMISGHPTQLDCVQFLGKRSVFVGDIQSEVRFKGYWEKIKKRHFETFDALYTDNLEVLKTYCAKNNIDYISVSKYYYSEDYLSREKLFKQPFNDKLKELVKNRTFAVLSIPKEKRIYEDESSFVLACSKI